MSSSSRYRNADEAIGGGGPAKSIRDLGLDPELPGLAWSLYLADGEELRWVEELLRRLRDALDGSRASSGRGENSDMSYSLGC